jgi:hypothetical protein
MNIQCSSSNLDDVEEMDRGLRCDADGTGKRKIGRQSDGSGGATQVNKMEHEVSQNPRVCAGGHSAEISNFEFRIAE